MLNPNFFNTLFVIPILNILLVFYKIFLVIKLPGAFGLSIIALTVFVRLILNPFFKKQLETAKKMQDLKPHFDKLSQKHKQDPKKLQQEQLRLYQQVGINPASGCLFMIIQIPIFIGLYNTLSLFFSNGNMAKIITKINSVLYHPLLKIQSIDPWFFGFNLALSPAKAKLWHYYLIPVLTGLLQYLQVQISTPPSQTAVNKTDLTKNLNKNEAAKNSKNTSANDKKEGGDFQNAMNTQMKFIFPLMIGWFSYSLPVGLSLYWNIFSLFSIIQSKNLKISKIK